MTAPSTRRITVAAAALAVVSIAGCAGGGTTTTTTSESTPATTTTVTTSAPAGPVITDQQAGALCSDLELQLSDWRVQGPTLGRGGLNILVQTWAANSGAINLAVVQDRTIVDTVTTQTCPEVRSQVIDILDIPDLATGLVGL